MGGYRRARGLGGRPERSGCGHGTAATLHAGPMEVLHLACVPRVSRADAGADVQRLCEVPLDEPRHRGVPQPVDEDRRPAALHDVSALAGPERARRGQDIVACAVRAGPHRVGGHRRVDADRPHTAAFRRHQCRHRRVSLRGVELRAPFVGCAGTRHRHGGPRAAHRCTAVASEAGGRALAHAGLDGPGVLAWQQDQRLQDTAA